MRRRPSRSHSPGRLALTLVVTVSLFAGACGKSSPSTPEVKVLLIGDSIMKQAGRYVSDELGSLPHMENVEVRNAARNGTGLLTPDLYDWYAGTKQYLREMKPDIVVVLFIGNYTSTDLYVNEDGVAVQPYSNEFFRAWEYEARRIQQLIFDSGADAYWVDPPPMATAEGQRRVSMFRAMDRRIAEDYPNTLLIDGTKVLSDSHGNFTMSLPTDNGQMQQIRTFDTVHLTEAGARILAKEIARQIAPSVIVAQRQKEAEQQRGT